METIKYTVIKSEKQYEEYCDILEELVFSEHAESKEDEIELLTLLIEDWDEKHALGAELDPVELVKSLKEDHGLNQTELGKIGDVGKSYISEILNYKKRMSKKVIRNLANHFKIQQEALNKHYLLEDEKEDDKNSNESKVISIQIGNEVSYNEQQEESIQFPLQRELEEARVN